MQTSFKLHRHLLPIVFTVAASFHPLPAASAAERSPDASGWTLSSEGESLTVHRRKRKDSDIEEVRAVGVIDARPLTVRRVIDDTEEYPNFMPYVAEARTLSKNGAVLIGYQRMTFPLIQDRDCTLRIRCETRKTKDGEVSYCNRWETANELGPAERSGVARLRISEGSWLLEPTNGGTRTRATYTVFCDSGGKLPAGLVNTANRTALPKLFDSVRRQAAKPKYAAKK